MRLLIAFVFMAIFSSCTGLILDTFGCMKSGIKVVRRHAIFHILTVVFCLVINGFCFWISERISEQQSETKSKRGKKIDVSFDVSYYLIVLASSLSILATAFTLIRRYPTDEDDQLERLLEEYNSFEEPLLHLERSLPAAPTGTLPPPQSASSPVAALHHHTRDSADSHNNLTPAYTDLNNNSVVTCFGMWNSQQQQQHIPPPPPSTPPPSLHSINYSHEVNTSEPPPPYDPAPLHV
jgi:hypothetical protein